MTDVAFRESVSVKLDGTGNGHVGVGPISARESWNPDTASVSVSTTTNEAECGVYVGSGIYPSTLRETTFMGSSGDSTGRVAGLMRVGDKVWAQWTDGDPNSIATLTVVGMKTV
jgi:hypothetical protein